MRTLLSLRPNRFKGFTRSLHRFASILIALAMAVCAPQLLFGQYSISTIAGGGPANLPAAQASLGYPAGLALDSQGNVYIADSYNTSQILEISASGKTVTVVAGNGTFGYSGDSGPATRAALAQPQGVYIDGSGNIYIADTGNSVIRVVNTGSTGITIAGVVIQPGTIQTVAGNGTAGFSGDGTPPTSAQLDEPGGVFLDGQGNIYIADTDNSVIRVINTGTAALTIGAVTIQPGTIQSVAGTPDTICTVYPCGDGSPASSAQLTSPFGVSVDAQGNIYIADTFDSVVRVVNPSTTLPVTIANIQVPAESIQAIAGVYYSASDGTACQSTGDTGPATSAYLCLPFSVSVDGTGNIFIADTANLAIRKVAPGGTISTVAGTLGTACANYSPPATACGNGGPANATGVAFLNYPSGVTVDGSDDLFIADTKDFAVREVVAATTDIEPLAGNDTLTYSGDGFVATTAQLGFPGGTFVDASGNVYIADTYNQAIRVLNTGSSAVTINNVTIQPGEVETVAGNGVACAVPAPGGCGDGGPATSAQLNFPEGIFVDNLGNIYIADTGLPESESSVIRVVNTSASPAAIAGVANIPAYGIATVAGTLGSVCTITPCGDGGPAINAQLYNPSAVVVDASGNIYIADTDDDVIRVVNTGSSTLTIGKVSIPGGSDTIATIAGTPTLTCADDTTSTSCGDGGVATSAYLSHPDGLALDASGNIYIADTDDEVIRVVNPSTTQPVTIAGTTIPAEDILTVAGNIGQRGYSGDGEPPTATSPNPVLLDEPWGVFVDFSNDIFIADTDNGAVREVVAASTTIQTIAGTGTLGFSGDGDPATSAMLDEPESVAVTASGKVFIADTENSRIRELTPPPITVTVAPSTATVVINALQQFTATVTGTSNTAVTWSVNGVTGGSTTFGTIDGTGLFQAPASVPSSPTVTISATSQADNTKSGTAQATIANPSTTVTVSVSPTPPITVYTCTTQPCSTQLFSATVTGTSNSAVTWYVEGAQGGDTTYGTIDTSGTYTGPAAVPSQATITIEAVSQADATAIGTVPATIVTAPSAAQPAPQTVSPGGTATYSLSLNANTGIPNQPLTLSCLQSSLPSGATCTFTPPTITPGSSAVPFSLAVAVPSNSASLLKTGRPGFAALPYAAFIPLAGILLLGGRRNRRCLWLALAAICLIGFIACGGGSKSTTAPVTYSIKIQGTSAAQPNPVTITTASLTVQ